MSKSMSRAQPAALLSTGLLIGFFAVLWFFGGASRADEPAQAIVRLASIIVGAISCYRIDREGLDRIGQPLLFLLALATVACLQLVPLPPALWAALPGRDLYLEAARLTGIAEVWRPLSLTPDLTINALLALLPAAAILLLVGAMDARTHRLVLPVLLAGILLSMLIGMLQVSSGAFYFYKITNDGAPVGLLANRNHQAVLLGTALPLLAYWAMQPDRHGSQHRLRPWLALCMAAIVLPLILVTGSRAGLIVFVLGGLMVTGLLLKERGWQRRRTPLQRAIVALPVLIMLVAAVAAIVLSRDVAVQRLFNSSENEFRLSLLPIFGDLIKGYWPVGSGFGSFDTVYRAIEPSWALRAEYLNHAHNDLAELLIETGLIGMLVSVGFLVWFAIRSYLAWFSPYAANALAARTGSCVVALLLVASLFDYPLRTPLMMVLLAIASSWLCLQRPRRDGQAVLAADVA